MACLPWTNGVSLIGVLGKRRSILSSATRPERHQVYSPAAPPRSVSTLPEKRPMSSVWPAVTCRVCFRPGAADPGENKHFLRRIGA
jgi:hypothetical protein